MNLVVPARQAQNFPQNPNALLNAFFCFSTNLFKKSPNLICILHYGDSQIEGDRISSYLSICFQHRLEVVEWGLHLSMFVKCSCDPLQSFSPQLTQNTLYIDIKRKRPRHNKLEF
jgi:hypothetical protein